eukprot:TRINITY_DN17888_c0_g1_i1.p1 TRINITY_DN17888_c0_g1~~TRINITY_DN17888_c0_g1_i1.p1  ORF type:complete len:576 (-),score=82.15 TRINITY_DN17888_c0_g1_i1:74-1801(-)
MPYPGGMARGSTPPGEIQTLGFNNTKKPHPLRLQEMMKGKPYSCDAELPFACRSSGLSLGVLQSEDVPPGPIQYFKDEDRSLMTDDIPRSKPCLAHSACGSIMPLPWNCLTSGRRDDFPEIERNRPKTHYPPISPSRRPRDLPLTTHDIEKARPNKIGVNSEGYARQSGFEHDPNRPTYSFPSSPTGPPQEERVAGGHPGRCTLDISDIEGTSSSFAFRLHGRDTMQCEPEFRSKAWRARSQGTSSSSAAPASSFEEPAASSTLLATTTSSAVAAQSSLSASLRPRARKDAQEPRYDVAMCDHPTSLHARWSEERSAQGMEPPATKTTEIGPIHGSRPRPIARDNGEPQLSLHTSDITGAMPMRRVGGTAFSIYGDSSRTVPSQSLTVADINGAQADTLSRAPRLPGGRRGDNSGDVRTTMGAMAAMTARAVLGAREPAQVSAARDARGARMSTPLSARAPRGPQFGSVEAMLDGGGEGASIAQASTPQSARFGGSAVMLDVGGRGSSSAHASTPQSARSHCGSQRSGAVAMLDVGSGACEQTLRLDAEDVGMVAPAPVAQSARGRRPPIPTERG